MNKAWQKIWEKFKKPPTWAKVLTFVIAFLSSIGSLCMLLVDFEASALAILAYTLFGIAGTSLAYAVYLFIPVVPKLKHNILAFMEKREFTNRLLRNFGFRTVVFSFGSFLMSLIFSAFNAYMGIVNLSIWYGALAAYYIALALLRGGLLVTHSRKGKTDNLHKRELVTAKTYRASGGVLLLLNIALSSAIAQMIFSDGHFSYAGWTIFAYAAYAFYKITMSIINLVRAHKQSDLTVQAIRNINLTDAAVSILALQTALLNTFTDGTINISYMNTLTGIVVSVFSVGMGIYMIISGTKRIKNLREEKTNE